MIGGHVIKLGLGNDEAAKEALKAWPSNGFALPQSKDDHMIYAGGLQVGGGITDTNALEWLKYGAEKV